MTVVTGAECLLDQVVDVNLLDGSGEPIVSAGVYGRVVEVGVVGLTVNRHDTTGLQFIPWSRVAYVDGSAG